MKATFGIGSADSGEDAMVPRGRRGSGWGRTMVDAEAAPSRMVLCDGRPERGTCALLHTPGPRCGTLPRVMVLPAQPRRRRPRAATVRTIARRFESDLSASVLAAGPRVPNVRQISERVAMGRALWRELVVGFASQLSDLRLGFTQLAALYVLADGSTTTIGELAESLGRSPSATSRLVDGLVRRRLVERHEEPEDRRQRSVSLTQRGQALLRAVDRARADQFLTAVRPLPTPERALVAMGVAALATRAFSRKGRVVRGDPEPR
jgi:DNA-binding MarR family transcriptional regulator